MKATLQKIKVEFLDLLGTISVDELSANLKLHDKLTLILELLEGNSARGAYV